MPDSASGPQSIREILGSVLARIGLDRDIEDYRIWEAWEELVGPAVARNAQPVRLDARRLVVAVKNNTWMQELSLLRADLVGRINDWMGRPVVTEIFLVVGRIEPAAPRSRSGRAPGARRTDANEQAPATAAETQARLSAAVDRLWEIARSRSRAKTGKDG